MSNVVVYVPKDRLHEYVVVPAPPASEVANYHVAQIDEAELYGVGPDHVFDPSRSRFVLSVAKIARRKRTAIESALTAALAAGMPYTMPDGTADTVQTRPDEDEANLLGLAIEARDLRTAGETGAIMSLRAKSNIVYALTPEQMIALTDAAKTFKQGLLAKSWQLKDRITAAEAAEDRKTIEAVAWETDTTTEETT